MSTLPAAVTGWEPLAFGFLLVLFRCAGLFMVAPIFGVKSVPPQVRMALALAVSIVAFQAAGLPRFAEWDSTGALVGAMVVESLTGISAGLAARLCIEGAVAAGNAAGISMGIGFAAVLDPIHGADSNALSELLLFTALAAALAAGLHREAIAWFCRSVIEIPPGSQRSIPDLATTVIAEAARGCSLAIRLGFPVMAAVLFGYVILGLLGRAAPQAQLGNIGYGVALLAGGVALYMVAPYLAEMVARSARATFVAS
jgi:flagellar biosynthetic protein FliR